MTVSTRARSRLRQTVSRHLRRGFVRAIFVRPGGGDEEIVEGDGGVPDAAATTGLLERALAAADAGRVKQTWIIDAEHRVLVDARHGGGKPIAHDPERVTKQMGGKDRALRPDRSQSLLQVIGIMNPDGTISAKHAKKYKQISHFVELCRPIWDGLRSQRDFTAEPLRVLDLGCGNGYLTFVMTEALRLAELPARLHGVDLRADVIDRCRERAGTLGYDELAFSCTPIADVEQATALLGGVPDLVVALHACDTATDDALALAIEAGARAILVAPCCQHELADQLAAHAQRGAEGLARWSPAMQRHGLLRQDFAATLTDALRIDVLEALGWSVDTLEFVDDSHTPKNLLLRARLRGAVRDRSSALAAVRGRCEALGVAPRLLERV